MKFLIIGDLHGHKPNIHFKGFDAILAPGDFCSDAPRKYVFQAIRKWLAKPESEIEWYDITGKIKARRMVRKSLEDGRRILAFLNSFRTPIYVIPGNWDWTPDKGSGWKFFHENHYKKLTKGLGNVKDVHHKLVDIGEYQIIGYGISGGPEYPQYKEDLKRIKPAELKKRKRFYQQQYNKLDSLFKRATKPVIFLSHNVPFGTPIDINKDKASPRYGYHCGSVVARDLINRYHPLVSIGGHMHEHFGKCKLGKTICINAGFGSHVNTWLELKGNKIKKLKFYRGK